MYEDQKLCVAFVYNVYNLVHNGQMIYLTAWHFKIKIDNTRKVTLHIWNVCHGFINNTCI